MCQCILMTSTYLGFSGRKVDMSTGAYHLGFVRHRRFSEFTAVADALSWALYCRGVRYLMHYLDDFLFLGGPNSSEASAAAEIATSTFQDLCVPAPPTKMRAPPHTYCSQESKWTHLHFSFVSHRTSFTTSNYLSWNSYKRGHALTGNWKA